MTKLIEIEDSSLEVEVHGTGQAIVFFTGFDGHLSEFRNIAMNLKDDFQCVLFNRPGIGKSITTINDFNVSYTCEIVFKMLRKLNIKDDLILVGHSYGGLCVQRFIQMYKEQIKGVLLIDSTSVDDCVLDELDTPILNKGTTHVDLIKYYNKLKNLNKEEIKQEIDTAGYSEQLIMHYTSAELYRVLSNELKLGEVMQILLKRNLNK